MRDIKIILEGVVSQAKPVGSEGSAFKTSSSSGSKNHGIDVGASRNLSHEVRSKDVVLNSAKQREQQVEKRKRESEQRQKETMRMAKEETVTEAKHIFHIHMKGDDMRSHKMVDDKTSEPVGAKPKSSKLVLKVPAADSREARNKVSKHIAKNYGVSSVKSIEYKGLDEEVVAEAKKFVFDKPHPALVKAYDKRDTGDLKGMHKRYSSDHSSPKNNPETSEKLLAVHHVLKNRGENMGELPKHKNLGLTMHEETNTEKRMKIKSVARMDDPEPTSEKSTLNKTDQIKTKIVEDKPTMSLPNFGLSASLINAARQIVEKKHEDDGVDAKKMTGGKTVVDTDPETNDTVEDTDNKSVKKSHTVPKTDKEKKLAALAHPKDKITHKDVLVGRGVVKEDEQLDELKKSTLSSYITKVAKLAPDQIKPSRDTGIVKASQKLRKMKEYTEDIDLSDKEKSRIAEIAKSFSDEQYEKEVHEAAMTASSPIRGANQDQAGFGTKSSTADYTISDSKKMKEGLSSKEKMKRSMYNKEEVEDEKKKEEPPFKGPYKKSGEKTPARSYLKSLVKKARTTMVTKEEVELDEARGRPRKNPLPAGKEADVDDTHKHPLQQLEKISNAIGGNEPSFEHKDGSKTKVGKNLARHMVVLHNSMRTSQEKDNFAQKLHANRDSMRSEMNKHF